MFLLLPKDLFCVSLQSMRSALVKNADRETGTWCSQRKHPSFKKLPSLFPAQGLPYLIINLSHGFLFLQRRKGGRIQRKLMRLWSIEMVSLPLTNRVYCLFFPYFCKIRRASSQKD